MKEQIEFLTARLEAEKAQLSKRQEYFELMVKTDLHTSNFEANAISALNVMLESKAKIKELEFILQIMQMGVQA